MSLSDMTPNKETELALSFGENLSGSENHKGFYLRIGGWNAGTIYPLDEDGKEGLKICEELKKRFNSYTKDQEIIKMLEGALIEIVARNPAPKEKIAEEALSKLQALRKE